MGTQIQNKAAPISGCIKTYQVKNDIFKMNLSTTLFKPQKRGMEDYYGISGNAAE